MEINLLFLHSNKNFKKYSVRHSYNKKWIKLAKFSQLKLSS